MSPDVRTDETADETADGTAALEAGAGAAGAATTSRHSYRPLIVLAIAAVVVIAALVVAIAAGDALSATAVRVNSSEVSQKTFNQELRDLAPVLADQGVAAGSVTSAFVPSGTAAQLAQLHVFRDLVADRVHVSAAVRRKFVNGNRKDLAVYSPAVRDLVVDVTLQQRKLIDDRGNDGASAFLRRLGRHADIHVDPRYGFWNPTLGQVCPPTGCASSTGGG